MSVHPISAAGSGRLPVSLYWLDGGRPATARSSVLAVIGLRFNRLEWAGAFGDLGTLIPFVVAYIALALFFGGSIETLLKFFPPAVLGVILFLTGAQLALGACQFSEEKEERSPRL
jgi:xanthine/uracil permease